MVLAELQSISGVPVHPLLVHLPVVFVPLAFVGAVVGLAVPRWRSWCLPLTAVFAGIGLVGVQVAIMSGEGLEELLGEESKAIEQHSQLAEQSRPLVFLFTLAAVLAAVAWHYVARQRAAVDADADASAGAPAPTAWSKALVPLLVLSLLGGAVSTAWVYRTGHTGAKSVWAEAGNEGGEGGEGGEGKEGADSGDQKAPTNQAPESGDHDSDGD